MFYLLLFIFGLIIGSFLNVLIDRLPLEETIKGRSHCDYCRHQLSALDLVPVLSFFYLKGSCRYCRQKISWFYPLVELTTAILFVLSWAYFPFHTFAIKVAYLGIVSCLIVVFFSDLKYQMIPDSIQIAFFVFSLFALGENIAPLPFMRHAAASVGVMGPILLIYLFTRGVGMGFGDVKFTLTLGFLLGLEKGFIGLYLAFIIGAAFSIVLILLGKKRLKSKIAFGPFLVTGAFIVLFWGDQLIELAKKIYGL